MSDFRSNQSVAAYPLCWPDGWPRTIPGNRSRGSKFRRGGYGGSLPTFATSRKELVAELLLLRATNIVISSSVDVRSDGVVRSGIDPERLYKEPGVAVYFLLKGKPLVMAQDAYDMPGVNVRSLTLAIDAMRSLERHGGGTMMTRAFSGFSALPPPEGSKPRRPWWEVLRYPADPAERELLSLPEVKARFNTLAKKLHPDAGGNGADMAELNLALEDAEAEFTAAQGASDA